MTIKLKKISLVASFCMAAMLSLNSYSQQLTIDTAAIRNWEYIDRGIISADGKYLYYSTIVELRNERHSVVKSITGNWYRKFNNIGDENFSSDGKKFLYRDSSGLKRQITLGESRAEEITILHSGKTDFFNNSKVRILRTNASAISDSLINLSFAGESRPFYTGVAPSRFIASRSNDCFAFQTTNSSGSNDIWILNRGKKILNITEQLTKTTSLNLQSIKSFSNDGKRLFVTIQDKVLPAVDQKLVKLSIWSYKDYIIQPEQKNRGDEPNRFLAVIDLHTLKLTRIQRKGEAVAEIANTNEIYTDNWLAVHPVNYEPFGLSMTFNWNPAYRHGTYLVSTTSTNRILVKEITDGKISPAGKYLYGLDRNQGNFLSYNIKTKQLVNMTINLPIPSIDSNFDYPYAGRRPRGLSLITFVNDDGAVIIHDSFDYWIVDPEGIRKPISVTNGFGRRNVIRLTTAIYEDSRKLSNTSSHIILKAFNHATKAEGFYSSSFAKDPKLLTMGPSSYADIKKAEKSNIYLVLKHNTRNSPNYFVTTDFKTLNKVTNVHPEKTYRWFRAELHAFRTINGDSCQGILYKPDDFSANRKYPVIFLCYEKMSDQLNQFLQPAPAFGPINIPWFVSHGYLVFTPDIKYTTGYPGSSAYSSVVGAARYLSQKEFVDSTKMGLQGHSFGGFETNYIVANSSVFAAACSAAGLSNFISAYGGLFRGGTSAQPLFEVWQMRIGTTPWERPDLYVNNSVVLQANRISTPMLIMHNLKDHAIPVSQSIELFTALRRLNRKAWMLQYEEGGHGLEGNEAIDFQLRMTQFFNHYLKGEPAPAWMRYGVPSFMEGRTSGFDLN